LVATSSMKREDIKGCSDVLVAGYFKDIEGELRINLSRPTMAMFRDVAVLMS
jgi:hypothetical protein